MNLARVPVMLTISLVVSMAVPVDARPRIRGIQAWVTPAFTIHARQDRLAQTVARQTLIVESVLTELLGTEPRRAHFPLHIYIAPTAVWRRYLRPGPAIAAEYFSGRFTHYIVMTEGLPDYSPSEVLNHEYAHYFLRANFTGIYPTWFDEGLAELMGSVRIRGGSARIELPRIDVGNTLSVSRTLRADKTSPEYLHRHTHSFHAQAWALVHMAFIGDPAFRAQVFEYLRAISAGVSVEDAVRTSFRMSESELGVRVRNYLRQPAFKVGVLPYEAPPPLELGPPRQTSELENVEFLARMMLDTKVQSGRVSEVVTAARALAPMAETVRLLELRAAVHARDNARMNALRRELESRSNDPTIARGVGLALFDRIYEETRNDPLSERERAELADGALELLVASERLLPVDLEASWALGILAANCDRHVAPALKRLTLAQSIAPANADLSQAAALLHERLAQREEMREQLRQTARHAHTLEMRLWALSRLQASEPTHPTGQPPAP